LYLLFLFVASRDELVVCRFFIETMKRSTRGYTDNANIRDKCLVFVGVQNNLTKSFFREGIDVTQYIGVISCRLPDTL
jgi:hypothetical protein